MYIDMTTVTVSYLITNAICTGAMALLWWQNRHHFNGPGFWLVSFGLQFISVILAAMRGVLPDFVAVILGNVVLLVGNVLLYMGLERFVSKPGPRVHNVVLLIAFTLTHAYFTWAQPNLAARNINATVGLLIIYAQCAWLLLHRVDKVLRPTTKGVGLVLVGYCLVCLVRIVVNSMIRPSGNDIFRESSVFDTMLVMTYQIFLVVLTLGLTLMVNRRLFAEIQADIAEREETEDVLCTSLIDLKLAQEIANIGNWQFDPAIGVPVWSEQIYEIYNRDPNLGPPHIDEYRKIYKKEQFAIFNSAIQRAIQDGEPYDIVLKLELPDGIVKWIHAICQPDDKKGPSGHFLRGTIQDITEQIKIEQALRDSQARLQHIFDAAPIGIGMVVGRELRYANAAICQLLGYTAVELVGRNARVLYPDDEEYERVGKIKLPKLLKEGQATIETRFQHKHGAVRDILLSSALIDPDNPAEGIVSMAVDITARKQTEAALRESQEQYRVLFSSFPLGVTVADRDGQILECNTESERLLGIPQREHKQRYIDAPEWHIIRPDGALMPAEEYASVRALQEGRLVENVEMGIVKPNGEITWINVTAAPLKDDRVVITYNDITARKRAEDALRDSEERFRAIVNVLPQFVAYTDKNLTYRFVNQTYQQKFNVAPEDVVGHSLRDVIGEAAFEEARPHVEKALRGEQVRYHERYDYAIGDTRDIDGILVPDITESGEVRGYYAVLTDITPYMEIQEALRQTTERLRILHEIDTAILYARSSQEIAIAALERLYHIIPCQRVSVAEIDRALVGVDDPHARRGRDIIILADGEVVESPTLEWHPLSDVGSRLFQAMQQGLTYRVDDIATLETPSRLEQILLEDADLRSYVSVPLLVHQTPIGTLNLASKTPNFFQPAHLEILEELAASLAVALQQARLLEQTQQDAETKDLLLREVNHRVKNNLDAIIGLLYLERRHASPEVSPAYQSMMDALVQRIISLAAVHSMLSSAEWQPLPLSELAERVIYTTRDSFPPSVQVSVTISPSPVHIMPDQAQHLALIISELAMNTLKYAASGRNTLQIAVDITQQEESITLIYRDDGPGYPEDVVNLERHDVGLEIIQKITQRNLHGDLALRNDGGAVTEIRFGKGKA